MKPTYASLLAAKNGTIQVTLPAASTGGSGLASRRTAVSLSGGAALTLDSGRGDPPGMWVHYLETRATYGLSEGAETWAASGPFSGCQVIVGKRDGRVFVAHLAQQSGSTADDDWAKRGFQDEVWARWKVPLPSDQFYSSSIVFVDWSKGSSPASIEVVRVDVKTKNMGGFDPTPMPIFNIVQVNAE